MLPRLLFQIFLIGFLSSSITVHWSTAAPTSQDVEIMIGNKTRKVHARQKRDQFYYRLRDTAAIFSLSFQEKGNRLTLLGGPRGILEMVDGRPLVRFGDEYILLSAAPWQRQRKDWCFSEDFFTRALPLILNRKIEKLGDRRYRVDRLDENRVQVKVTNQPDHVRIVFTSSQKARIEVRDFQHVIQVKFSEYLVKQELPSEQPDPRLVPALEFESKNIFGAFHIYKGKEYYNFRQYNLKDPERKVIDVYAPPPSQVTEARPSPKLPPRDVSPPLSKTPKSHPSPLSERVPRNVVTIDAGHGGENYGVHPSLEILEKNFTLKIASRISRRLRQEGYQAVLTRSRDVDLPIEQRSAVGNHYQSKAYISIHAGGSASQNPHGPLVYVYRYMDLESLQNTDAERGGQRVPTGVGRGSTVTENPQGSQLTPWEEGQRQYLPQSRALATLIQKELNSLYEIRNQVLEVPLAILAPVSAPAVLVETGFFNQ